MLMKAEDSLKLLGQRIESRFIDELPVSPVERFDQLLNLKNLQGESTGYIKVFSGDRIEKGSSLSIDIMPGMRYFNIHLIPEADYLTPRYLFEGMLSSYGSQASIDLFPDVDVTMDVDYLLDKFGNVTDIYDAARADEGLHMKPSRYMHMRAFASPFFICAFDVAEDALPRVETIAERYFDEWQDMLRSAPTLEPDVAAARRVRRSHVAHTLIREDPDRNKVVDVYGEACTQAIEEASML